MIRIENVDVDADQRAAEQPGVGAVVLAYGDDVYPGTRSYGEVPFGGSEPKSEAETPWDANAPVAIPETGFNIAGYIDRLDISGDGKRALVRDYKTGRPLRGEIRLKGGRELQRCLYAFAVKALLGDDVAISASLLYPREPVDLQLDDPETVLAEITVYLRAARSSLAGGAALPGPDTGGDYDDLAFALSANASATYCKRKMPTVTERLGEVAPVYFNMNRFQGLRPCTPPADVLDIFRREFDRAYAEWGFSS